MLSIRVIQKSNNPLPKYQTGDSAGMDLLADLKESIEIKPLERVLIGTGLQMELPSGYEAQIRPRSGLALKHGITVLNSPGTVDADYRGEVKVLLVNLSQEVFRVEHGDRIAQMVINKVEQITWEVVDALGETERGAGALPRQVVGVHRGGILRP